MRSSDNPADDITAAAASVLEKYGLDLADLEDLAALEDEDGAPRTDDALGYADDRVHRVDRRAIGNVTLTSGAKRAVYELRADSETRSLWHRVRGGRLVYLLGKRRDGSSVVVGGFTTGSWLAPRTLAPSTSLLPILATATASIHPADERVRDAAHFLLERARTTIW